MNIRLVLLAVIVGQALCEVRVRRGISMGGGQLGTSGSGNGEAVVSLGGPSSSSVKTDQQVADSKVADPTKLKICWPPASEDVCGKNFQYIINQKKSDSSSKQVATAPKASSCTTIPVNKTDGRTNFQVTCQNLDTKAVRQLTEEIPVNVGSGAPVSTIRGTVQQWAQINWTAADPAKYGKSFTYKIQRTETPDDNSSWTTVDTEPAGVTTTIVAMPPRVGKFYFRVRVAKPDGTEGDNGPVKAIDIKQDDLVNFWQSSDGSGIYGPSTADNGLVPTPNFNNFTAPFDLTGGGQPDPPRTNKTLTEKWDVPSGLGKKCYNIVQRVNSDGSATDMKWVNCDVNTASIGYPGPPLYDSCGLFKMQVVSRDNQTHKDTILKDSHTMKVDCADEEAQRHGPSSKTGKVNTHLTWPADPKITPDDKYRIFKKDASTNGQWTPVTDVPSDTTEADVQTPTTEGTTVYKVNTVKGDKVVEPPVRSPAVVSVGPNSQFALNGDTANNFNKDPTDAVNNARYLAPNRVLSAVTPNTDAITADFPDINDGVSFPDRVKKYIVVKCDANGKNCQDLTPPCLSKPCIVHGLDAGKTNYIGAEGVTTDSNGNDLRVPTGPIKFAPGEVADDNAVDRVFFNPPTQPAPSNIKSCFYLIENINVNKCTDTDPSKAKVGPNGISADLPSRYSTNQPIVSVKNEYGGDNTPPTVATTLSTAAPTTAAPTAAPIEVETTTQATTKKTTTKKGKVEKTVKAKATTTAAEAPAPSSNPNAGDTTDPGKFVNKPISVSKSDSDLMLKLIHSTGPAGFDKAVKGVGECEVTADDMKFDFQPADQPVVLNVDYKNLKDLGKKGSTVQWQDTSFAYPLSAVNASLINSNVPIQEVQLITVKDQKTQAKVLTSDTAFSSVVLDKKANINGYQWTIANYAAISKLGDTQFVAVPFPNFQRPRILYPVSGAAVNNKVLTFSSKNIALPAGKSVSSIINFIVQTPDAKGNYVDGVHVTPHKDTEYSIPYDGSADKFRVVAAAWVMQKANVALPTPIEMNVTDGQFFKMDKTNSKTGAALKFPVPKGGSVSLTGKFFLPDKYAKGVHVGWTVRQGKVNQFAGSADVTQTKFKYTKDALADKAGDVRLYALVKFLPDITKDFGKVVKQPVDSKMEFSTKLKADQALIPNSKISNKALQMNLIWEPLDAIGTVLYYIVQQTTSGNTVTLDILPSNQFRWTVPTLPSAKITYKVVAFVGGDPTDPSTKVSKGCELKVNPLLS